MEETQSNKNGQSSKNETTTNRKLTALERCRKTFQTPSNANQTPQDTHVEPSIDSKPPSSTTSETRDLWKLVKRLAENAASTSSIEQEDVESTSKPEPPAERRFKSIPSIVERLRSANITDKEIRENLSEEERQAEQKRRMAMKWKMAVRTASTKAHTAPPSLMNDIKKLEAELDEFKDELRQYHQLSIAFTPPQYQRDFVVREMDEEEFNLALQKDRKNTPSSFGGTSSVRSSVDLRSSVESKASLDSSQRRQSVSTPRSPRVLSTKSSTDEVEPRPPRPKSANNPRGYGSRWFLPVDAWSSFEKQPPLEPVQEEEIRIAFKRMDNIDALHSSKAFKQFLLERNEQRLPHFLDTNVPVPPKPNANATLPPSTTHATGSKSNATSPEMIRRRKSISGPLTRPSVTSRPSTTSTTSSFRSFTSSTSSRMTSSPPPPKRQISFSPSKTKTATTSNGNTQMKQPIGRSASVGSLKSRSDKPRVTPPTTTTQVTRD